MAEISDSPEQFLEKLKRALKKDGDFPASAKVVTELRKLASDPRTPGDKITELILREPSLGTRVLSLVNSAYFQRIKPIMTISQAVVQLGMKQLAELCAGLVLLQKFVPQARQSAPFAQCLKKSIITSLVTSAVSPAAPVKGDVKQDETGYLAGAFLELGVVLLAFYFPQVYDSAVKRAETKLIPVSEAIKQITGLSVPQISGEIIRALELPQFYIDILMEVEKPTHVPEGQSLPILKAQSVHAGKIVASSEKLSMCLSEGSSKAMVDAAMASISEDLGISPDALGNIVGGLPTLFADHCQSLQLALPELPDFVRSYSKTKKSLNSDESTDNQYDSFLKEIKQSIEQGEPTASIITSVMETLAFGLKFERVILLLLNNTKQKLVGRMMLGNPGNFEPGKFEALVTVLSDNSPSYIRALHSGKAAFEGTGVFDNGWPLAAIPIGSGKHLVGVIYADSAEKESSNELSESEKKLVTILTELLEKSLSSQTMRR